MATLKYNDDVILLGSNVQLFAEAGKLSSVFDYRQSGQSAGKATDKYLTVNGATYVECSETYQVVPAALGGGTNKTVLQYVDATFVIDTVPTTAVPTPAPAPGAVPGATPGVTPGTTPTTGSTTTPVSDRTPAGDGTDLDDDTTATDKTTPTINRWLTIGLGAVLALSIVGLVLVIVRTAKQSN